MQLQTAIRKESEGRQFLEFALVSDKAVVRTQIERRDGLVFMRAKRRSFDEI